MKPSVQKANLWKRISAWMFDAVMIIVVAMALAIPMNSIFKYDEHYAKFASIQTTYIQQAEVKYGIVYDLPQEEYNLLDEAQKEDYNKKKEEAQKEINENLQKDEEAVKLTSKLIGIMIANVCLSSFIASLVWNFVIPLFLKDGRTLGKKIFGLAVVRTNCVKITAPILFVRSMIGLFAMETLAVALLCTFGTVGIVAALAVQVLQIWVLVKTPTQSIHDLLSDTIVVDYSSQRIFETQEELNVFLALEDEPTLESTEIVEQTQTISTNETEN